MPAEIMIHVLDFLSNRRSKTFSRLDLYRTALLSKKWHKCANAYLWYQVDLSSRKQAESFCRSIQNSLLGMWVRHLSLYNTQALDWTTWSTMMNKCPGLLTLYLERVDVVPFTGEIHCFFPKLRSLVIYECPKMQYLPFEQLVQASPNLKRLSIAGCQLTEQELVQLVRMTPRVTDLSLGSSATAAFFMTGSSGGNEFAKAVVDHCPHITCMDLTGILSMTDDGFTLLMQHFGKQLVKLQVKRAMQVSEHSLLQIGHQCPKLTHLTLANIPHMDDTLLEGILGQLGPQLQFLQLESLFLSSVISIRQCTRLLELRLISLSQWGCFEDILGDPSCLEHLQTLLIYECPDLEITALPVCSHAHETLTVEQTPSVKEIPDSDQMARTPESPLIPPQPFEPFVPRMYVKRVTTCTIASPDLQRLELVGCFMLEEEQVLVLLKHWQKMSKFFYLAASITRDFRREARRVLPNCDMNMYVLSHDTPTMQMEE
ncbi:hypothetical protein EDD86DRAFT_195711 [Gorgonomyces haynaldii]|nr:hypothetical protein EDD86DRAFT_195711 [Gorgonomyces haynaldii]